MNFDAKMWVQFALCAFVFGAVAALCSLVILASVKSNDWLILLLTAPLAASLIAILCWRLFTLGGRKIAIWKGAITGVLAGSVSHFFAWYLAIVCFYFWGIVSSDGSPTVGLLDGFFASFVMTLFSLALVGWLTIPVGAIVGSIFAALVKRRYITNWFN